MTTMMILVRAICRTMSNMYALWLLVVGIVTGPGVS